MENYQHPIAFDERMLLTLYYIVGSEFLKPQHDFCYKETQKIIEKASNTLKKYFYVEFKEDGTLQDAVDHVHKILLDTDIRIGEHKVEFLDDGIKVGCTHVDKETIKKIAKEFK